MLHPELEARYQRLVSAWHRYHDVKRRPPSLTLLADVRQALDDARTEMHRLRRALAPEPHEAAASGGAALCPAFGATVFAVDGRCACGDAIGSLSPDHARR